LTLVFVGNFF